MLGIFTLLILVGSLYFLSQYESGWKSKFLSIDEIECQEKDVEQCTSTGSRRRKRETCKKVTVHSCKMTLSNGKQFTQQYSEGKAPKVGQKLRVFYDPKNPSGSMTLKDEQKINLMLGGGLFVVFFIFLLILWMTYSLRNNKMMKRAYGVNTVGGIIF
jgi:hypothetical protein